MAPLNDAQKQAEIKREEDQEKEADEDAKETEDARTPQQKKEDADNNRNYQLKKSADHALRGFAYFDTMEDLYNWKERDADPLHKANTPLLKRPPIPDTMKIKASSNLLVMTDYRGSYVEGGYEAGQGAIVNRLDYNNEYWQRIEAFNYFSHHRVSIPPAGWINAGHRNGALVLGTFCIETGDGTPLKDSKYILEKKDGGYRLADVLARMAAYYGFDGWLMNIECSIYARGEWDDGLSFGKLLSDLKSKVGKVVWYDALRVDNVREWQNTVNSANLPFAIAAGSIVTNYFYDLRFLENVVEKKPLYLNTIYSGVDCWGQTDDGDQKNSRTTFGFNNETGEGSGDRDTGKGHGGTATGLAVKALGGLGLGVGLFAHGWAYEHVEPGTAMNRYMWEGGSEFERAAEQTTCKCHEGLPTQHLSPNFVDNPIKKHATQYPAGSESFFYTDYTEVFVPLGAGKYRSQLNQQSVNPEPGSRRQALTFTPSSAVQGFMVADLKHDPSRCTVRIDIPEAKSLGANSELSGKLTLHNLNAKSELNPDIVIAYHKLAISVGLQLALFVDVGGKPFAEEILTGSTFATRTDPKPDTTTISIRNKPGSITAIGISMRGPAQNIVKALSNGVAALIDIFSLTLRPSGQSYPKAEITDLKLEPHGTGPGDVNFHHRLVWNYKKPSNKPSDLPFSDVAGPFSHFIVKAGDDVLGQAYTLGFIIDEAAYKGWKKADKPVVFSVEGFSFDGELLGIGTGKLHLV